MANVTITQLPAAGPITGQELVPIVQNGQTVQTTTAAVAASPAQFQTFLTLNQEPTLANSRALSGSTGVGLVDGGPLSTLQVTLNGVSGSLEAAGEGIVVKSGGVVVPRQLVASGNGLQITNGTGISGNPTIGLTGALAALAGLAGTGILGIVGGNSVTGLNILGTSNQIAVANGSGPGNPTVSIVDNPTLPGTEYLVVPKGTSAQRPNVPQFGMIRANTDSQEYEVYYNGVWTDLSVAAGFVDIYNNGSLVGTQDGINFIPGTGLTYSLVNNTVLNRVDVTQGLANTAVTAGAYGSASSVGTFTVDAQGRLTAAANASIAIDANQITSGQLAVARGGTGAGTFTANGVVYGNGTSALQVTAAGTTGDVFIGNTSAAPSWAALSSLTIGTATNIAGGTVNQIPVQTGAGATSFIAAPTVANTFLEWSGSAFQWATNPLGTVTSVDVSGGTTGLTYSGGPITTSGTITMAGTLITSNGGTGISSFTAGDTLYYASGTVLSKLAIGSAGFFMTSSGTAPAWTDPTTLAVGTATNVASGAANQIVFNTGAGATSFITAPTVANTFLEWSGSAFQWATNPLGTVTSVDVSGGTTGLTTSGGPVTTSGTITIAGTLITTNGGTGLTTYTAGDLPYYATGTALSTLAIGAVNSVLASTGTAPNWVDSVTLTTVNATTFDTNVAAAGVTLSGVTLAADGTDANIDILLNPKGTGGVGIGGDPTGVVAGATITSKFCVKHDGTGQVGGFVHANNTTAASGAGVFACRSRGTIASPTIVQNNDRLTTFSFAGYDGVDLALAAQIDIEVDGVPGSNDMPGRIRFLTTADGTQSPVEALRIDSAQDIRVANLTASKPVFSDANKNLTSTGTLATDQGGTGLTTYTAGDIVYYASGTTLTKLALGTQGQVLRAGAAAPEWASVDGGIFT